MVKIAYILLCHKDPDAIIAQARRLTAAGDAIAIHFDGRAPRAAYQRITAALGTNPRVTFARRRIRCGWGEWSLVQATLEALQAAVSAFPDASHFYMLSGDCMPIKTAEHIHRHLADNDRDFIETVDYFEGSWIKTGLKEERLIYRHYFNERGQKRLFYAAMEAQRRLGLQRDVPPDLSIRIGSQWWCLRRATVLAILEFLRTRRDVIRFFRRTWIPDETFFQTLVPHLVPDQQIEARTLTFLLFSDYGMPVTFYEDQYDFLTSQDYLFARKISPEARRLKQRLGDLYLAKGVHFAVSQEGPRLYRFLTESGRIGRRFAPRFWEKESTIGRERELLIISCKKWHVAKRLVDALSFHSNLPALDYIFDEEAAALPDLGGIQTTLGKRTRHRRALMRMLFDYYESDRLAICLDPANLDLVRDFYHDRCTTRLLHIDCQMDDAWLVGHAYRVGLAGPATPPETLKLLLPTIRNDLNTQADALRDEDLPEFYRLRERGTTQENAQVVAAFFSLGSDQAHTLVCNPLLFQD